MKKILALGLILVIVMVICITVFAVSGGVDSDKNAPADSSQLLKEDTNNYVIIVMSAIGTVVSVAGTIAIVVSGNKNKKEEE